jgi:hypothetical protein
MTITLSKKSRGMVLYLTLGTIAVLAIIIAAYISLVNNQSAGIARSQTWNQAIPVAESGVEEAMTQLYFAGTNAALLTSNSWTAGTNGIYHKSRTFSDGTYFGAYIQVATNPIIISTGFVYFAYDKTYISRRVKVVTTRVQPTPGGLNARGGITFEGNSYMDSFNSGNPLYSTNGQYASGKREKNASAVTDSTNQPAISMAGGATIYGNATTGPNGTVNGTVTGTIAQNANVQFNDISAPYSSGVTPTSGTNGGTSYTYLLNSSNANYYMTSLSMSSSQTMYIGASNVTLYINGSVSLSGQSQIIIATNASVKIYLNGSASFGGGGIVNDGGYASQCTLYGLPNCSSISLIGGAAFIGTVYAPEAALTIGGNAGAFGSFSANTIDVKGTAAVHYDEGLAPNAGYVAITWNEF